MKRKDAITKASRYSRVTSCRTGEILPTPSILTISSDAAFLSGQTADEAWERTWISAVLNLGERVLRD